MLPPSFIDVTEYLGDLADSWNDSDIQLALDAEAADQANRCRIPDPFPAALGEALCRRVAHNLALRRLPLGVQTSVTDAAVSTTYVGGMDAEVRRLEAPYRKRKVF